MRKLVFLVFLAANTAWAQGRPTKEICLELSDSCQSVDSAEVVELKTMFNFLVRDLNFWLDLKRDFGPSDAAKRFDSLTAKVVVLQTVKDALTNDTVKNLFQVRIDETLQRRDRLNSTEPGSKRDNESKAQNIIAALNQQLNDVQAALSAF